MEVILYEMPRWKENWEQVRGHYAQWWNHQGPVLRISGLPRLEHPRDKTPMPPLPSTPLARHTDPDWLALSQRAEFTGERFPADNLPLAVVELGCTQLAAVFGAEPSFDDKTVWYTALECSPEEIPPLILTKKEKWWNVYRGSMLKAVEVSGGDFLVGMPAFGSNLDVLAELRGTQNLLYDLLDREEWVKEKLEELNQAFFAAYDDYYERIKLSDGSSAHGFFHLWGPGKTAQVQCDFSAMISPDMFADFVVPPLRRQCAWLDHSLFHLDGTSCLSHVDHLLAIPELDAIQWTPGIQEAGPGDAKWDELYGRILGAGKSVQILNVNVAQAHRIFDKFGSAGLYVLVKVKSETEAEEIESHVESLRRTQSIDT